MTGSNKGAYLALGFSTALGDKKQTRIWFNSNLKGGTKTGGSEYAASWLSFSDTGI
jgi:hypothetical protein